MASGRRGQRERERERQTEQPRYLASEGFPIVPHFSGQTIKKHSHILKGKLPFLFSNLAEKKAVAEWRGYAGTWESRTGLVSRAWGSEAACALKTHNHRSLF